MARPRADRIHERPTPFLGGLALLLALLLSLGFAGLLHASWGGNLFGARPLTLLVSIAVSAFLLGLVDDLKTLSPPAKFAGQVVIAAAFLAAAGPGPARVAPIDGVLGLLWIVGLMNAANVLDNMDGTLAGAAIPGAFGLAFLVGWRGDVVTGDVAAFALALGGALLGYFAWNRPPARIFFGDAGSLLVGAALATAGWLAASGRPLEQWLALPFLFAWPIFDLTFVIVTRTRRGQPPWVGGRDHTTHRLATLLGSGGRSLAIVIGGAMVAAVTGLLVAGALPGAAGGGAAVVRVAIPAAVAIGFTLLGFRLARVPVS